MADENLQRKLDNERQAREEAEREMADFRSQLAEKEDPATGIPKPILIEVQGTAFEPGAFIRDLSDPPQATAEPEPADDEAHYQTVTGAVAGLPATLRVKVEVTEDNPDGDWEPIP